ncbi:glycosyltransferase family 2 protein [Wolbachia endosymbiont of Pentidionis agamae]|uniref:glycosyltransferase family 2 protein n=1 Tax=Wolbachia endosymbiont of Pentidionis agamae TaxID=3110435 RepID=UPI002FCF0697
MSILGNKNIECDYSLWKKVDRALYYKYNCIPWQKLNNTVFFILSKINREVLTWLKSSYKSEYLLFIVDHDKIIYFLNSYFGNIEFASNYLYYKNSSSSAKDIKYSSLIYISFLLFVSICTLIKKYSYFALMVVFIILCANSLFKLTCTILGFYQRYESKKNKEKLNDEDLPMYTILLPVFKEREVIEQLISNINAIDYPKSKLDIKLILEDDDIELVNFFAEYTLPEHFDIIKVPNSFPQTKAKACNYAMFFAKGEYVVVYDADDKPEHLQLKKALVKFREGNNKLACVQAKLSYYNSDVNFLTRSFHLEYMNWFHYLLPGFEKANIPIPLGGSSVHFSVEIFKKVFLFDAYNVTEDADLGLRFAQMGYRTAIIDSETMEESPIKPLAWIKQRARWIKGYIQTYIVHLKNIKQLYINCGLKGILLLNIFIGSTAFIFFLTPFLLVSITYIQLLNKLFLYYFVVTYCANLVVLFLIIKQRKLSTSFYITSLFFPVYRILHSIASFRALVELITCPQHWNKTKHGYRK